MSRKDSRNMFTAVLGELGTETSPVPLRERSASPHLLKVAAGVRELNERSQLVDRLLRDGEQIVELDPTAIVPSSIADRLDGAYNDQAVAEIVDSIRERGQISAGLVRPIPGQDGRFQIVFGRRRLAAAQKLGIKFKAVVRELTEEEAVIFQGEENANREDLSFIEKCAFALALEQAGHKRATICSALSTSKSHVSEMIKIAAAIPRDLLLQIGRAPGIGRGRWTEFAERIKEPDALRLTSELTTLPRFEQAESDARFNRLFAALAPRDSIGSAHAQHDSIAPRPWVAKDNSVRVTANRRGNDYVLALSDAAAAPFGTWISDNLDRLYRDFRSSDPNAATGD
ncbi:plasmid partitioning protein RepB [Arvimicrobium flavum]|uniref:plasmid partitioning protein RepB n=1 Tax=Arvimicrobium flavum TaxID=3393320 RepID=UPI00237A34E4|nr:plasmid partitioning protein RepB [Mesorhizobium shangrilense]